MTGSAQSLSEMAKIQYKYKYKPKRPKTMPFFTQGCWTKLENSQKGTSAKNHSVPSINENYYENYYKMKIKLNEK